MGESRTQRLYERLTQLEYIICEEQRHFRIKHQQIRTNKACIYRYRLSIVVCAFMLTLSKQRQPCKRCFRLFWHLLMSNDFLTSSTSIDNIRELWTFSNQTQRSWCFHKSCDQLWIPSLVYNFILSRSRSVGAKGNFILNWCVLPYTCSQPKSCIFTFFNF